MLTIYKSRTAFYAAEEVLSKIKEEAGRHVVIAPDPFTLAVEKAIANKLGKKGIFDVEVMSFARLAVVALGSKIKKCLSPAGSVMLMEKVVCERASELLHYRRAAGKAGFAAEMYAAITSVRNSGVTPEQLEDATSKLSGYVKDKTHDIALLYRAYLTELALRHTDSTTRLEALVREIEDSEDFGDVHFHVVDHVDLNAKQMEVVSALMEKAKSVSVAVTYGEGAANGRIYPTLYRKLRRAAEQRKISIREIEVASPLTGEKAAIGEELFSYSFSRAKPESLSLAEAKDVEEEVTYLATEITSLVRKEGFRYADVAVITPSFEEYLPYVERIFRRYEIPLFSDDREPLSSSDVFRHIVGAMEIATHAFEGTLVRRYVLHELFEGSAEEKADFCDYVDRSGVDRTAFKYPFVLFAKEPLFAGAEKMRESLLREIGSLSTLPAKGTVASYAEALRAFLAENLFDEKIKNYAEKICDRNLKKQAEIVRQTPAAMMDLLDTFVELRGKEEITYAEFVASFVAGAEQVKIAALPVSLDCVYFAPVKQAMYAPIGALFVIGAEEGAFPLEKLSEGILGRREYAAWQSKDIEIKIENTGVEELAASRFHALQLLLRGERLYLSHLEAKPPSSCIGQLREIFRSEPDEKGEERSYPILKCSDLLDRYPIDVRIPTRAVAANAIVEDSRRAREGLLGEKESRFARAIAECLGVPFPLPYVEDRLEDVKTEIFFPHKTVSASELECYFKCPFLHFVRFGLNAKERKVARYDRRDVGNIAHKCMEIFVSKYVIKGEKVLISDEEAREIAARIAVEILGEPYYLAIANKNGRKVLEREIKRCSEIAVIVKNQIYQSDFNPTFFEKDFGKDLFMDQTLVKSLEEEGQDDLRTILLNGMALEGKIDRVDLWSSEESDLRYAVALDYKTGNNQIESDALYFGEKVQLQLYLAVLRESGFFPVAALYASLSDAVQNKPKYLFGPKWENLTILKRLDKSIKQGVISEHTGVSLDKKTGAPKEDKGMLMSGDELVAQSEYAVALSEQAVGEIRGGFIRPSPLKIGRKTACEYCEFKAVCRHAGQHIRDVENVTITPRMIYGVMHKGEEEA